MTDFKIGDRVYMMGTVTDLSRFALDDTVAVLVNVDGTKIGSRAYDAEGLTLISSGEPPVSSVVVKDGVAWHRSKTFGWHTHPNDDKPTVTDWSEIHDGDVVFRGEE